MMLDSLARMKSARKPTCHDKLGTMWNIHRWAFFFIAIGIALWVPGVSPQLGIIVFVIGLVGLVIAWVVR
jgi:hypothetical protein